MVNNYALEMPEHFVLHSVLEWNPPRFLLASLLLVVAASKNVVMSWSIEWLVAPNQEAPS